MKLLDDTKIGLKIAATRVGPGLMGLAVGLCGGWGLMRAHTAQAIPEQL